VPANRDSSGSGDRTGRGPRHWVLVVEDEAAIRELLVAALCAEPGLLAAGVADGARALVLLEAVRPSLVLLDLMMPQVDGFELARRVRATPGLEGLPLVAMSALGGDGDRREQAFGAGCDAVVAKPFELEELLALLRHHIDGAAAPADHGPLAAR
jgi:CheY-like chemotaxis protein